MAVERVIALFKAAQSDVALKNKIQNSLSREDFINRASGEGYEFNIDELNLILKIAKQTSLNPCSIEQVFDDSSDYLEEFKATDSDILILRPSSNNISELENISVSEEDDTNDAGFSRTESLQLRKKENELMGASLDINILSEVTSGIKAKTINNIEAKTTLHTKDGTKRLTFRLDLNLSEPHLLSWTDDLAQINSILKK
ncbi:hypothetical protein PRNO82_03127 [Planktothrix rubescens]|jgi:hypothetical protein|nr:hypothetical protein PRNO82_03127 [Planktothrix rubescens]